MAWILDMSSRYSDEPLSGPRPGFVSRGRLEVNLRLQVTEAELDDLHRLAGGRGEVPIHALVPPDISHIPRWSELAEGDLDTGPDGNLTWTRRDTAWDKLMR